MAGIMSSTAANADTPGSNPKIDRSSKTRPKDRPPIRPSSQSRVRCSVPAAASMSPRTVEIGARAGMLCGETFNKRQ